LNRIRDVHDAYDFLLTIDFDTSVLDMLKSDGLLIGCDLNRVNQFSRNKNRLNHIKVEKKNGSKIFFLTKGSSSPYHQGLIQ
jgi:hypothetical protein